MTERELLQKMLEKVEVVLPATALDQLLWFRDELLRWNKNINLTAITDPLSTLEKHLVDSLTLLPYLSQQGCLLDMGSGGGFPSLPLKIARPALRIWSVDAVAKKIAFQKHVVRTLKLTDFTALHARLEALPQTNTLPAFDLIVTRAFSSLREILSLAEPLLALKGQVVAMKGADGLEELADSAEIIEGAGFRCQRILQMQLPQSRAQRCLLFFSKTDF
jgi:16S rRNA (guanine527-N7)-methyltransferase